MLRSILTAALLSLACAAPACADEPAAVRYAAWQSCLNNAFALQASLSGKVLAADSALRDCRERESAYLAELSTSPLLDDEDVARARPMLVARARLQLQGKAAGAL